jgi:heat shock protein HslJ
LYLVTESGEYALGDILEYNGESWSVIANIKGQDLVNTHEHDYAVVYKLIDGIGDCGGATYLYYCTQCGEAKVEIEATSHEYNLLVLKAPTCDEEGAGVMKCAYGDHYLDENGLVTLDIEQAEIQVIDATGHDWDEPEVEGVAPTCTENGTLTLTYECINELPEDIEEQYSGCVKVEVISVATEEQKAELGSDYVITTTIGDEVTVAAADIADYSGKLMIARIESLPATGHDWDEPEVDGVAPTCTENGSLTLTYECVNELPEDVEEQYSGCVKIEVITVATEEQKAELNADYVITTTIGEEQTVAAADIADYSGKLMIARIESLLATGHNWDEPTITGVAPTCTENGTLTLTYYCINELPLEWEAEYVYEGAVKVEVITVATADEKLEYNSDYIVTTTIGEEVTVSAIDAESFGEYLKPAGLKSLLATGHNWDEPTITGVAPTCTENGTLTLTYYCLNELPADWEADYVYDGAVKVEVISVATEEQKALLDAEYILTTKIGTKVVSASGVEDLSEYKGQLMTAGLKGIDATGHNWDVPTTEGVIPTCTENGSLTLTYECINELPVDIEEEYAGAIKTVVITVDTTGEQPVYTITTTIGDGEAVVETADSLGDYEGYAKQARVGDLVATGHDWDAPTPEGVAPTCTENGTLTLTYYCVNELPADWEADYVYEGAVKVEVISVATEEQKAELEADYVITTTIGEEQTVEAANIDEYVGFLKQVYVNSLPATGHNWDEPTIEGDIPTCTENGTLTLTYECANELPLDVEEEYAGTIKTVVVTVDATGEQPVYTITTTIGDDEAVVETADGLGDYEGYAKIARVGDLVATGHEWEVDYVESTIATCDDNGTLTIYYACVNEYPADTEAAYEGSVKVVSIVVSGEEYEVTTTIDDGEAIVENIAELGEYNGIAMTERVGDLKATGHNYEVNEENIVVPTVAGEEVDGKGKLIVVCANDASHTFEIELPALPAVDEKVATEEPLSGEEYNGYSVVVVPGTCVAEGSVTYTITVNDEEHNFEYTYVLEINIGKDADNHGECETTSEEISYGEITIKLFTKTCNDCGNVISKWAEN